MIELFARSVNGNSEYEFVAFAKAISLFCTKRFSIFWLFMTVLEFLIPLPGTPYSAYGAESDHPYSAARIFSVIS